MRSLYFSRTKVEVVVWDKQAAVGVVDIDFREKVVVILSSPEKLDDVFAVCAKCRAYVRGLMIDEAHLREEWPFRNYLASDRFTSVYPIAMVGIFSATLENATIEALKTSMGLFDCKVFDRNSVPALRELEEKRLRQLVIRCCQLDELKKRVLVAAEGLASNDSIVIFAATYDVLTSADGLVFCKELAHLNPMVYAASFDPKVRERVIAKFSSGECRFVVATCAFGTGVDFPNIRYVFFDHAPKTWSGFMQHAGRAGRGDLAKQVFITVACGPTDLKACDRRVQILAFYCPATKSGAKKIQCPDCQAEQPRPPFKSDEFSGRCFDFLGVACNTTRQACLRTIAGFFQGLYVEKDLVNRKLDCSKCSACSRKEPDRVVFVVGNTARVIANHPKHAGFCGVVAKVSNRIALRRADGIQHALSATNLVLESAVVHVVPKVAQKNKLDKEQRILFANLIRAELARRDLVAGGLFCAGGGSEAVIKEAAKVQSHKILPPDVFDRLLRDASTGNKKQQFDHVSEFKAFRGMHEAGIEAASKERQKQASAAIKRRRK
jgi:hypothetical protein